MVTKLICRCCVDTGRWFFFLSQSSVAPQVQVRCETELERPEEPSTGEKEKYMKALNEAIAMGRRSTWASSGEEGEALDSRSREGVQGAANEDLLQILDQKHQSDEIEKEIKESALEENTSKTQEILAGTKKVMYHEDGDEDEDMLQIWDQKCQSIEIENENKESAMEETTSETQEIHAGNQEVMCSEEDDEDMLQILDQQHQSIECEDENKEPALKSPSDGEETNLETQEIPAGNPRSRHAPNLGSETPKNWGWRWNQGNCKRRNQLRNPEDSC